MIAVDDKSADRANHVTITKGLRGYFVVLVWWCPDHGGFWEPLQSGVGSYETAKEAEPEARAWASDEGVEYHPPKEVAS